MSNFEDRFNQYINTYPRQSLQMLLIGICLIWMSPVCVLGLMLYALLAKVARIEWWYILPTGILMALAAVYIDTSYTTYHVDVKKYLMNGFSWNKGFWKLLFTCSGSCALDFLYQYAFSYLVGFPLLFAGVLSLADLIKDSPHKRKIDAIQKGEHYQEQQELPDKKIQKALCKLDDAVANGVLLGVSTYTGSPVVIPDYYVNQIVLVLGTTGSGKTVTLRRFYQRAVRKGYPMIVVDGKPTKDNVEWLQDMAVKFNRKFYGFNCGNYAHYDPLANGDCSELKDKIISLKDQWENDYYRSIAEDYLQTTFEILLQSGLQFDLKRVVKCLDYEMLKNMTRDLKDNELLERVDMLESYERKDITGLRAHLNLLVNSEMGGYFKVNDKALSLAKAIQEDAIVYFALPALKYPSFSRVLGKLVINDIKATIESNDTGKPVFMIFDEFSVFAGDQVLNLVNMGRGKGVHAVFGTQGIADLNTVSPNFKAQMLNCANTLICHRLNDQESAEDVAAWMGTRDDFNVTAQFDSRQPSGLGSVKAEKGYIVHPETIKQRLRVGQAYVVSKIGAFMTEKIKVFNC